MKQKEMVRSELINNINSEKIIEIEVNVLSQNQYLKICKIIDETPPLYKKLWKKRLKKFIRCAKIKDIAKTDKSCPQNVSKHFQQLIDNFRKKYAEIKNYNKILPHMSPQKFKNEVRIAEY